jgi:DUF4097 and DUF4098 domain-containing protein YvlB
MYEFPSTGPIVANLHIAAGTLHVIAEDRASVEVTVEPARSNEAGRAAAEGTRVEMNGNTLTVETPNSKGFGFVRRSSDLNISIRVPADSELAAESASADMFFEGRYTAATVKSASGDLRLEHVSGDLERHSASGDSEIGRVGGNASITKASGDLRMDAVGGDLAIKSASGDITVGSVGASARVSTASGDIRIDSLTRGEARLNAASGDINVGVAEGTAVWLDLNSASGDSRSELPVSDASPTGVAPTLTLHVRTASGDINVRRAAPTNASAPAIYSDALQD